MPAPRRPPFAASHRRSRALAAAALGGALVALWLVAGPGTPSPAGTAARPSRAQPAGLPALRDRLPHPEDCRDLAAPMPTVQCSIDGVDVDVRLLGGDAGAAYAREVGVRLLAHDGPPRCARGEPEERTWTRVAGSSTATGRYDCVRVRGRAAMWWTDEQGLLWHAVARNGDLAALFDWWRRHP